MRGVIDYRAYELQKVSYPIVSGRLAQQRESGPVEIGALVFRCPMTQRDIECGIEMERCTFQRIGQFSVSVCCAACRHRHDFKVANGSLKASKPVQPRKSKTEIRLAL